MAVRSYLCMCGECKQSTFPIVHRRPHCSAVLAKRSKDHGIVNSNNLVGCRPCSGCPPRPTTESPSRQTGRCGFAWLRAHLMEEARALLLENCHMWKVKPHPAIGRILCRTRPCAPMKTRGRGLPLRKKKRSQIKGQLRPTASHSGAEHSAKTCRCKWKDLRAA